LLVELHCVKQTGY